MTYCSDSESGEMLRKNLKVCGRAFPVGFRHGALVAELIDLKLLRNKNKVWSERLD